MSFTNSDLVGYHISFEDYYAGLKKDYPLEFADYGWVNLPGKNILPDSVILKTVGVQTPVYETVIFGTEAIDLNFANLIPASATLASDKSLSTLYTEQTDFSIDCKNGTIVAIDGGSIVAGSELSLWYYRFITFEESADFQIDYQKGRVRILDSGVVALNQTVLIDYELSPLQLNDDIIARAVDEANAVVGSLIDSERDFGADLTLQTAATYLAVSIVCRMAASADLIQSSSNRQTAVSWINLSENYRKDYELLIRNYRPESTRLNSPVKS